MESVKETLNAAGNYASNAATSVQQSLGLGAAAQTEEHKSMIDDKVRTGTPGQGGQAQSDKTKDFAAEPEGPNPGQKPQGTNVQGDQGMAQNKNPMSNQNEPNTGFGGGSSAAAPSVDAKPQNDSGSNTAGGSGSQQATGGGMGGAASESGMKLPESHGSEEGTGQKYEKSTGMKADGGDFDASRPGAGREAERLLDEKGIHHGVTDRRPSQEDDTKTGFKDAKGLGLRDTIKEKFHKS